MRKTNLPIFTFENIVFLSDRDVLRLVEEIDNVTLLQACKKCDDFLIQRIVSQFSQLGRDYFCDDFARIGSVPDDEILAAQNRIGEVLSRLYLKGQLKDWDYKYAA